MRFIVEFESIFIYQRLFLLHLALNMWTIAVYDIQNAWAFENITWLDCWDPAKWLFRILNILAEDEPDDRTDDEANAQRQYSDDKSAKLQGGWSILLRKILQRGDVDRI